MSEVAIGPGGGEPDLPPPGEHPFRPPILSGPGTWSLTRHGVRTVAVLELRQRVKSSRWIVILLVWALVVGVLTALIRWAVFDLTSANENDKTAGATMFGVIVFMVLSLGALVSPALSATSVNGDRTAGVLATMQSTLLTPAELAVGKLLAAWACALALLAAALPFVVWAYLEGGTPIGRLLVTLVLLALTLLVVCAVGLGYSALTARTSSSAVLTYLTVTFLGVGLPILFGLTVPMITTHERIPVRERVEVDNESADLNDPSLTACQIRLQSMARVHTERSWWLLAPSPYVVVADAAPRPARTIDGDPLTAIRTSVRAARLGPPDSEDWCGDGISEVLDQRQSDRAAGLRSTWPYGLAVDLLLGAGFLALTVRRLRTPADRLPRGTRVA
jgi:ABC-type transport system involved in multi-copper enzyme maturation permease subunit